MSYTSKQGHKYEAEGPHAECERLRGCIPDEWLDHYPVHNEWIVQDGVYRIDEPRKSYSLIVVVLEQRSSPTKDEQYGFIRHDANFVCAIIGGDDPINTPGGNHLIIPEWKLRRSVKMDLA